MIFKLHDALLTDSHHALASPSTSVVFSSLLDISAVEPFVLTLVSEDLLASLNEPSADLASASRRSISFWALAMFYNHN